jgi:hypothetical protein
MIVILRRRMEKGENWGKGHTARYMEIRQKVVLEKQQEKYRKAKRIDECWRERELNQRDALNKPLLSVQDVVPSEGSEKVNNGLLDGSWLPVLPPLHPTDFLCSCPHFSLLPYILLPSLLCKSCWIIRWVHFFAFLL